MTDKQTDKILAPYNEQGKKKCDVRGRLSIRRTIHYLKDANKISNNPQFR